MNEKTWIPTRYIVIVLLLLLGFLFQVHAFQAIFSISLVEEIAVVILLATALLWVTEAIPLYITSLAVLFFSIIWLLPGLEQQGIQARKEDFLISFFGDITLLFMGGFVLAALMTKYGISQMIAQRIIKRTGSSPARILLSIILVSSLLSMWMSNTATAAMMFAIIGPFVIGLPETSPFSKALALAIPFACNLGGLGTPIGTPPNAIAMDYLLQSGIEISFAKWMMLAFPLMILLLFLLWRLLIRLFPPGKIKINMDFGHRQSLGKKQYAVLTIFLITVAGWLSSGYTGVTAGMVGLFVVLAAFSTRLLETRDFKNISWDILFMLGGGLCLGVCLNKSGLADSIASLIPVEGSLWVSLSIMIVLAALMTSFMSNTATANLLIPIAVSLPQGEIILAIAISLMCSSSMPLPISTPPNAIAFGSGFLKSKEMFSSGLIVTLLAMAGIFICCDLYLPLFF